MELDKLSDKALRTLVSQAAPSFAIDKLYALPSVGINKLFSIDGRGGERLLLALPPPPEGGILSPEELSVRSEEAVLNWLSNLAEDGSPTADVGAEQESSSCGKVTITGAASSRILPRDRQAARAIQTYLPRVVESGSLFLLSTDPTEYNLTRPTRGDTISTLARPLDKAERGVVDFQTGQFLRSISTNISPTRRFGVAKDIFALAPLRGVLPSRIPRNIGAACWSDAFFHMLEGALQAAATHGLAIGYEKVRRHFDRFEPLLNAVTRPSLMPLDAGDDTNIMVLRSHEPTTAVSGTQSSGLAASDAGVASSGATNAMVKSQIRVTGLRDWSNCLFGDPLMASVFNRDPSEELLRGFNTPLSASDSPDTADSQCSPVEDQGNAHVRLLLHECYHAVTTVIKAFVARVGEEHDRRQKEAAARNRLAEALTKLEKLDDSGRRRAAGSHKHGSCSKKARLDEDDTV